MDKRTIDFLSTYVAVEPMGSAQRFNASEKKKTPISRPDIVAEYNKFMGGVDLSDMLLELYRINRRHAKWYMRIVFWILGVSVTNAWLLTREHNKLQLLDFQADVAYGLLHAKKRMPSSGVKKRGRPVSTSSSSPSPVPSAKRRILPSMDVRKDHIDHMPEYKTEKKCALCSKKTNVFCKKCQVNLCFIRERNCFVIFHE